MAHNTSHAEEPNAQYLDSSYWRRDDEDDATIPEHWTNQAHNRQPPAAPRKPQRKVFEMGYHGADRRLVVAASTRDHLEETIQAACLKGWKVIEMYEGIDTDTGWPSVWMHKPVEQPLSPPITPAQSGPQHDPH